MTVILVQWFKNTKTTISSIWLKNILYLRKEKAEKSKRIWRKFIEVKDIPKVSWVYKEEKPYYDTSNIVEMWPCNAFYIKLSVIFFMLICERVDRILK